MNKKSLPALGIDLGGTKISAALVQDHKVVGDPYRIATPHGPENIVDALLAVIDKFNQEHVVVGVGIATAGIVDPNTGQIVGSTGNLPGWEGTPLKKIIESKRALRVHVENDANAAAFGEVAASPKLQGKTCVVCVTLGTGIGVGIVIDGKMYRGAHFAAGEGGHIKISMENRRRCTCELWDCWETYGSGRGFLATGWEMVQGIKSDQSRLYQVSTSLSNKDILDAAKDGDVLAQRIVDKWHEHIACGLVSLCHLLDPDVFVITGGMAKFVDFDVLREMVADRTLPRISERLEIHPSLLNEAGGMVGAAELVLAEAQLTTA